MMWQDNYKYKINAKLFFFFKKSIIAGTIKQNT